MSASSEHPSAPFGPVRRVVTGHSPTGDAMVLQDSSVAGRYYVPESKSPCYDLHYASTLPASNDAELKDGKWKDEIQDHPEVPPALNASSFRCWDFAPGDVTPAHRTQSLDYGIVMKGSVVLELDNGERTTLNEGDTVVQRGTMHTWRNETSEWCKMYFVMIGANPVEIGDKKLVEEFRAAK